MASLVIVESPTKARTIRDFLPKGYHIAASMGHIRDLPDKAADIPAKLKGKWARLGVNVDNDFEHLRRPRRQEESGQGAQGPAQGRR